MGQKVNPVGFRVGVTRDWDARWFAQGKDVQTFLHEDEHIRRFVKKRLFHAGVASIEIERAAPQTVTVRVFAARPGLAIGRKGEAIEALREDVQKEVDREVQLEIREVSRPETNAQLVAEGIAVQLERRVSFRRAMKKAISNALKFGVAGIKVRTAGRLGGRDMARVEWYRVGRLPLQTLRADVDYGLAVARTKYGVIGVKVWVFRGEKFHAGTNVSFGTYGLQTTGNAHITSRQIEAGRIAITRKIRRGGKVWIRIFPDKPVTKKPLETRMGKGKGNVEHWVAPVRRGRILFELDGVSESLAREAMRLAAQKLPVSTRFVVREGV